MITHPKTVANQMIEFYPSNDFTGTCLSGRTILLKNNRVKLVPMVGLGQISPLS